MIINCYHNFFRTKLSKFNDDVEMLILFVNENNVIDLKQTLYFLIVRDRKTIDNILDLLMRQDRLQKISLKIISLITLLTFVVWKNNKLRVMIDFRKINT